MQDTGGTTTDREATADGAHDGRRRALLGGALALALLAGSAGVAALAGDEGSAPRRTGSTQGAVQPVTEGTADEGPEVVEPVEPVEPEQSVGDGEDAPPAPQDEPAADRPTADTVSAGTYQVRVLGEGWDARGRYVLVDRGRLSDGPPAEPGVDGTRPVVFDTGTVAERLRLDLAEAYALRFARSGGEPSYGPGSWADLVTEIGGRGGMLATVQVDGAGRLTSLEEPYRP